VSSDATTSLGSEGGCDQSHQAAATRTGASVSSSGCPPARHPLQGVPIILKHAKVNTEKQQVVEPVCERGEMQRNVGERTKMRGRSPGQQHNGENLCELGPGAKGATREGRGPPQVWEAWMADGSSAPVQAESLTTQEYATEIHHRGADFEHGHTRGCHDEIRNSDECGHEGRNEDRGDAPSDGPNHVRGAGLQLNSGHTVKGRHEQRGLRPMSASMLLAQQLQRNQLEVPEESQQTAATSDLESNTAGYTLRIRSRQLELERLQKAKEQSVHLSQRSKVHMQDIRGRLHATDSSRRAFGVINQEL